MPMGDLMNCRALRLVASSLLVLGACSEPTQTPVIELTGDPTAALRTPLSAISNGVESSNGTFIFVDKRENAIVVASSGLDTAATIGRSGEGPGEYRRPARAIADGKGGAIIPDEILRRALFVSPSGLITGEGLSSQETGFSPIAIRGVDPRGRLLHFGPAMPDNSDSLPIQRWDPATRRSTRLGWWPMTSVALGAPVKAADGTTAREIIVPEMWPPRSAWVAFADGSVAIVRPNPYRVEIISPDGVKSTGPPVDFQPVRVTAAHRNAIRQDLGPMPDDQFPKTLPPFEGFDDVIGRPQGEVWVQRMRAWNDATPRYDVFGANGVLKLQVVLRPHSRVVGFGTEGIYVARRDPVVDLWYLERYPAP